MKQIQWILINFCSATATTEVQEIPLKSSSDAILITDVIVPGVQKTPDVKITKSVIIDALIKTTDSLASATVSTLVVEATTDEDEEDEDEYGQPEVDNGINGACIASLCGKK